MCGDPRLDQGKAMPKRTPRWGHHHRHVDPPAPPRSSAASAPRWNANVSRTWNRGHEVRFTASASRHRDKNMNTRSRALVGIEKSEFRKIILEKSARLELRR